jgi:hypothetical protein
LLIADQRGDRRLFQDERGRGLAVFGPPSGGAARSDTPIANRAVARVRADRVVSDIGELYRELIPRLE